MIKINAYQFLKNNQICLVETMNSKKGVKEFIHSDRSADYLFQLEILGITVPIQLVRKCLPLMAGDTFRKFSCHLELFGHKICSFNYKR